MEWLAQYITLGFGCYCVGLFGVLGSCKLLQGLRSWILRCLLVYVGDVNDFGHLGVCCLLGGCVAHGLCTYVPMVLVGSSLCVCRVWGGDENCMRRYGILLIFAIKCL